MGETYIISEISKKLNIEPHVLRYWEDELELQIKRNQLGYRYYDEQDILVFKRIKELKEKGLQLKAVKSELEGEDLQLRAVIEETKAVQSKIKKEETKGKKADNENGLMMANNMTLENNKVKQFAEFMKLILKDSMEESNKTFRENIRKDMANEIEKSRQYNEAVEEKRFKKLDETLREMQRARQEVAITKRKRFIFWKNKK